MVPPFLTLKTPMDRATEEILKLARDSGVPGAEDRVRRFMAGADETIKRAVAAPAGTYDEPPPTSVYQGTAMRSGGTYRYLWFSEYPPRPPMPRMRETRRLAMVWTP